MIEGAQYAGAWIETQPMAGGTIALGVKASLTPVCIFHSQFCIESIQGAVRTAVMMSLLNVYA